MFCRFVMATATGVKHIRCISDIHVDDDENRTWIESLPERPDDVLILAGDISDDLDKVRKVLRTLKSKYKEVLCVPGNHDLWLSRSENGDIADSVLKYHAFQATCSDEGVICRPLRVEGESRTCCVVPLLSWHHKSFDTEPDITCWKGVPRIEDAMVDFRRCKWPEPLGTEDEGVARFFDGLNEDYLPLPDGAGGDDMPIISFSHFVPRVELNPEKRFLFLPCLPKAVGSTFLGKRVEELGSAMHVFGHTHFGWDATIGGIRYLQAALGYSSEWSSRPGSMEIGALRLEPIVIWSGSDGFVPPFPARWSDYYKHNKRQPELSHLLSPYVAPMYEQLPGGEICDWPMGPPKR